MKERRKETKPMEKTEHANEREAFYPRFREQRTILESGVRCEDDVRLLL